VKPEGLASLGVAQLLALLASVASGAVYAAWLDTTTLAAWALALAAARAALLLLDAGLKTALVRSAHALAPAQERRLQGAVGAAALLLSLGVVAASGAALRAGWLDAATAHLLRVCVPAYLLSHALLLALARLERQGRFGVVGRAEGVGTVAEFAGPGLLMTMGIAPVTALACGCVVGRSLRALWLLRATDPAPARHEHASVAPKTLLREGLQLQGVAALSMVRDTLHLWLVGPWFGSHWAGAYAFAMLACMVASQATVALAARVALPVLRALAPPQRAQAVAQALRRLGLWTVPPLLALTPVLMMASATALQGRWADALAVLPWLALRVLMGLPLALLSPWLLVAAPPAATLAVHRQWTLAEAVATTVALAHFGPLGLAWVWPLGALLGLGLVVWALHRAGTDVASLPARVLQRRPPVMLGH
jgi:O-antigen/teichoic acid export membrane protein